jgi:hypothetical protein
MTRAGPLPVVLAALLALCAEVRGQAPVTRNNVRSTGISDREPSHVAIPDEDLPPDLAKWLADRKGHAAKQPSGAEFLQRLLADQIDVNDPEALQRWLAMNRDLLDPKTLEGLKPYLQDLFERDVKQPQLGNMRPEEFAKRVEDAIRKQQEHPMPVGPKIHSGKSPMPIPPPVTPPPQPQEPRPNQRTREMGRWLERNFGESEAVHNMVRDLSKLMTEGGKSEKLFSWLPDWKADPQAMGSWAERNLGFLKDVKLPDLKTGGFKMPSVGGGSRPSFGGGGSSSGGGGFSGGGGSSGSWIGLVIIVLLGAAGVAVAMVLARRDAARKAMQARPGGLGPWPVDPALISSRAELVKAFDYLSLVKCGEVARVWNHRTIAGEMGAPGLPQREAAGTLASFYEHARYAPLDEDLTDAEYAEARRRFRVLTVETPA